MVGNVNAHVQIGHHDSAGPRADGELDVVGVQLGHAQRNIGLVLLGRVGRQVRAEGDRVPHHGPVHGRLDHTAVDQDGNGADGVQVPGRLGRQRRGH